MHPKQNMLQHRMIPNKLKPGLLTSYDFRLENKTGLFWK